MMRVVVAVALLALGSGVASAQSYDVSGYDEDGRYVYGEVDADPGDRDVEGYIYTEDGEEKHFEGEWVDRGEIEGYDEDGNYIELEAE